MIGSLIPEPDGARKAFVATPERLHQRYAPRISRHIQAMLGADQDREDLLQEVLITVLRKIDTLRDPACLDAWVNAITTNTLKYVKRRRRLRRDVPLETLPEPRTPSVVPDPQARDLALRAIRVVGRLPAGDRVLLTRYWFTPATAESIAAEAGCSIVTVRRKLGKARLRFEKLARNDPALAGCIDDARTWSRRWRTRAQAL